MLSGTPLHCSYLKCILLVSFSVFLPFDLVASIENADVIGTNIPFPFIGTLKRVTLRNLLKRDYRPDEFELPGKTILPKIVKSIYLAYNSSREVLRCPLSTYDCGNYDVQSNLKPESLGSCAVIASGSSILKFKYGSEIDSLDTVFRIGFGPVQDYRAHVGSRTDVLFVRTPKAFLKMHEGRKAIETDYTGLPFNSKEHLPKRFFLSLPTSCQKQNHKGKPILKLKLLSHTQCNKRPLCNHRRESDTMNSWYDTFANEEEFKAATKNFLDVLAKFRRVKEVHRKAKNTEIFFTHGFEMILSLLHSELCTFIHIFGFSKFPTYHYFDSPSKGLGRRVRPGHVMGMEYFILEQLSKAGLPLTLRAGE